MSAIKKLGDRVEREHNQFLRDSQRIEDMSANATTANGSAPPAPVAADFESLVGQSNASSGAGTPALSTSNTGASNSWDDDVWGALDKPASPPQTTHSSAPSHVSRSSTTFSPPPLTGRNGSFQPPKPSRLGSSAISASSTGNKPFNLATTTATSRPSMSSAPSFSTPLPPPNGGPSRPNYSVSLTATPAASTPPLASPNSFDAASSKPNYSFDQSMATGTFPSTGSTLPPFAQQPPLFATPMAPTAPAALPPMMGGGLLMPSRPPQPQWPGSNSQKQLTAADLGDFDPLA